MAPVDNQHFAVCFVFFLLTDELRAALRKEKKKRSSLRDELYSKKSRDALIMKSVFDWKQAAGGYASEWRHQNNRRGNVYHPIVFQVITPNLPLPLTPAWLSLLNAERFKLCPWC